MNKISTICKYQKMEPIIIVFPEYPGKLITVHLWHHDIQYNQIYMIRINQHKGISPICDGQYVIIFWFQHGFQKQPGILIIVASKKYTERF